MLKGQTTGIIIAWGFIISRFFSIYSTGDRRGGILFAMPRTLLYRGPTVYIQQNNLDIEFDHFI